MHRYVTECQAGKTGDRGRDFNMRWIASVSYTHLRQGADAFSTGRFLRVPMINGGNRDEMRLYVAYAIAAGQIVTADTYPKLLASVYGDAAPRVYAEYPLARFPSVPSALGTVESDFIPAGPLSNCLYLETARAASRLSLIHI